MDSVNQSTSTYTEPSDHIDHKFREDLRLRQPLSQQPLDSSDNTNVSNNTTIGAIAGSVGHSLHDAKDKIVESAQNLNQNIKERIPASSNEGESMGAKMSHNLSNVKDKILQAGSNLTENIKEKFSHSTTDNRDMSNVNNQKEGRVNNDDDEAQWVEEIVKEIETSNNSNESHIDHQFREDFRLRQPLVQQPLDATDKNLQTDVASNTSPLVMESAQHTLVDAKDKIIEVAHDLTETVKEKTSSTNQEVSSTNVDEPSGPTLKEKVITSLENAKESVSATIANTSSAVLEVKDKTKEQVKEIKDSTVHALHASTDKVNQSLHNLGNAMIDIKDKSIEQAITLKDNVVHSLNTAGSTVNKSMRDVGSTLVNIKEKTIEQTTTLVNKLPTEVINNTLQSAKEQIVNVVHTIQDKANQSMDTSSLSKDNDETLNVNDSNNNNNNTLKDKLNSTLETAKEQLSNVVQITQERVNESSYLNNNNDEKGKAVEILRERSPQPYEITKPITETLPTSDNLIINNPPKDDNNINELKDEKDTSFHNNLNPNAPEFKSSTSQSPLMKEDTKNLNENNVNNDIQYKNKDLLNDFVEPHDKIVTCGVQDSFNSPLPDVHYKNDPIHGSPMENMSEKFHSMVNTVSNMISNLWNHNNNNNNNNNNNPNRSNQEIDPNMSQPQLLDTTKSGVIAKNQDNRHGLDIDN